MWSKVLDAKFMGTTFEICMENAQKSQKEDEKATKKAGDIERISIELL